LRKAVLRRDFDEHGVGRFIRGSSIIHTEIAGINNE
jgi:hypothetical protein